MAGEERQQLAEFVAQLKQALRQPPWSQLTQGSGSFKQSEDLATLLPVLALAEAGPLLVVLPLESQLRQLQRDLQVLGSEVAVFPSWGSAPLRGIASRQVTFAGRSALLGGLLSHQPRVLLSCFDGMAAVLPPPSQLRRRLLHLQRGQSYRLPELERQLTLMGYLRVPRVTIAGEFALRGELIDLFPPGADHPLRLRFSFDELEEIVPFDFINQRSLAGKLQQLPLCPTKEICWDAQQLGQLEEQILQLNLQLGSEQQQQLNHLAQGVGVAGEEFLFALASAQPSSLLDYLAADTRVLFVAKQSMEAQHRALIQQWQQFCRGEQGRHCILPPTSLFYPNFEQLCGQVGQRQCLILDEFAGQPLVQQPLPTCQGNLAQIRETLARFSAEGYGVHIGAASAAQAQRLRYLFRNQSYQVHAAQLERGFILPHARLLMLQEHEILGHRPSEQQQQDWQQGEALDSFFDLEPGDYVVHVNHGIGRFRGIERLKTRHAERDYIAVEFADDTDIFVPIEQMDLLQRYVGSGGGAPRLDQVGGTSWQKRKSKTQLEVEDLADQLVRLYARRSDAPGFVFPDAGELQVEFEADFPYQETLDQLQASSEILRDMGLPKPMDRLLCGDVGFGKTEVAMRACFKAVSAGKQVAFLCPTTILAEQHTDTFTKRFQRFPVRIACLSRLISPTQQKKTLQEAAEGKLDILIGTHRLLSKDVRFRDLGLLVIDEEQRFGVKSKEQLKKLKTAIDCLTLSATPIPRTLHMSMLEIRDMSVLTVAPRNRHPVETTVGRFETAVVAAAIRRELDRGGQVFYLHNRVETLAETRDFIRSQVPEAMVEMAHGQMPVVQLEDIMHRFIHQTTQVLVATTIIENGIDIPNANTIIIDRADLYGVSQLYQLRGRVGRSDRVAYAYLLYPEQNMLNELAVKRLQIISDFTELGSGFKVAIRDLEVRGAGNLLGAKQSGHIAAVGFDLYLKLLNQAIRARQPQEMERVPQAPVLELEYSGFIPDTYVPDAYEKMEIYQRIGSVHNSRQLTLLYEELNDRFGPMCEEVSSLMNLAELRVLCFQRQIGSVKEKGGQIAIQFLPQARIDVDKLLLLMRRHPGQLQLRPDQPNLLLYRVDSAIALAEKSEHLRELLSQL